MELGRFEDTPVIFALRAVGELADILGIDTRLLFEEEIQHVRVHCGRYENDIRSNALGTVDTDEAARSIK